MRRVCAAAGWVAYCWTPKAAHYRLVGNVEHRRMTRADRDRRAISRGSPRIAYCPSHAIEVVEIHTQTSTVMSDYRRILWSTLAPETEVGMPKRSNEFQRLVAMLTALSSEGATVHESVEVMEIASKASREVDVVAVGTVAGQVESRSALKPWCSST